MLPSLLDKQLLKKEFVKFKAFLIAIEIVL